MEPTPEAPPFAVPPPPPPVVALSAPARPGELTPSWGSLFWMAWLGITGAFVGVWVSSRNTGLSTWWLGPQTEPRPILLNILPLVAPLALTVMGLRRLRWLPWAGLVGAAACALFAIGDVGRVNGYAVVEFALAAGGLLVSAASFTGMYRTASL